MCQQCLHEVRPERGRTCFDHGAFLPNFRACASCGTRGVLHEKDRNTEESEEPSPVEGDDSDDYLCETTFNRTSGQSFARSCSYSSISSTQCISRFPIDSHFCFLVIFVPQNPPLSRRLRVWARCKRALPPFRGYNPGSGHPYVLPPLWRGH